MSDWRIVTRPAYRAVGMKWEGTFQEVPELKKVIHQMRQRVDELEHAVNRDVQLVILSRC